jgi:hypothetical protein
MKRTLKPVFPPAGIEREYEKRLKKAVREMEHSVVYWLRARYRANESRIVGDSATDDILKSFRKLLHQWERNFRELADVLPRWFVTKIRGYVTNNLAQQTKPLKDAGLGFNLKFSYMSQRERQTFQAIVKENVNLIKSIARESLTQVEGIVLRNIEAGHDLARMTEELHKQFGVTERRARMIARDQTNKATNNLSRQRLLSYGINKGIWMHTASGKTYRETHALDHTQGGMDGAEYFIDEGCYDPNPNVQDYIQPGELVNCYCVCRPVIPQLSEEETEAGIDEIFNELGEPLPETPKAETAETQEEKPQENISTEEGLSSAGAEIINSLEKAKVEYRAVNAFDSPLSTTEIIERIGGGDLTQGSCASQAFCYVGNKAGLEVYDFRGGNSWGFFSNRIRAMQIGKLPNVISFIEEAGNDFKAANTLLSKITEIGKEYYLATGQHAAIIRKVSTGYEYLELQAPGKGQNKWYPLNNDMLKLRFGCRKSHTVGGERVKSKSLLIDIDTLGKSKDFRRILGYINTAKSKQLKGVKGRVR